MEVVLGVILIAGVIAFRMWVRNSPEGQRARAKAEAKKGRRGGWFIFWE